MNTRLDSPNSVEEIIERLSDEEKALHRELIAECRMREMQTIQSGIAIRENMAKLGKATLHILSNMEEIYRITLDLERNSINAKNRVMEERLRSIPDDRFFNA